MVDRAKVSSLDAVDSLRTSILMFSERATRTLDEVGDDVRRARIWVQEDQMNHWQNEKRRAQRKLEQAEQELYSSRMSTMEETSTEAQMMVRRSRAALEEAEKKIRVLKKWARDFDSVVEPLARRLGTMEDLAKIKYPKAAAELAEMIRTLESYADISPASPPPPSTSE